MNILCKIITTWCLLSLARSETIAESVGDTLTGVDLKSGPPENLEPVNENGRDPVAQEVSHKRGAILDWLPMRWFRKQHQPNNVTAPRVDHRDYQCFTPTPVQVDCDNSFIFAAMSLLEYHYCMQTKKLAPLSVQYVIDCAEFNPDDGNCVGGDPSDVIVFSSDYGVKLGEQYPLVDDFSDECPAEDARQVTLRFMIDDLKEIEVDEIQQYIENDPLLAVVQIGNQFSDYSGDIDDNLNCQEGEAGHSMLLVGQGNEDGHNYWLFRNSYGTDWGENGYYKMSQNAQHCIETVYFVKVHFKTPDAEALMLRALLAQL